MTTLLVFLPGNPTWTEETCNVVHRVAKKSHMTQQLNKNNNNECNSKKKEKQMNSLTKSRKQKQKQISSS